MQITTRDFGDIEIKESDIILFQEGIPGFEELTKYVMIKNADEELPFHWLQSIENPQLAFIIINPFLFKKDYDFTIPKSVVDKLEIKGYEDVEIYSIVSIPEDFNKMTANLLAPLIINPKKGLGKQLVLDGTQYHTRHLIIEEINQP